MVPISTYDREERRKSLENEDQIPPKHPDMQLIFAIITGVLALAVVFFLWKFAHRDPGKPEGAAPSPVPSVETVSSSSSSVIVPAEVTEIRVYRLNNEIRTDFTMRKSDDPVVLTAAAYPSEKYADATFTWISEDDNLLRLVPSNDTQSCAHAQADACADTQAYPCADTQADPFFQHTQESGVPVWEGLERKPDRWRCLF